MIGEVDLHKKLQVAPTSQKVAGLGAGHSYGRIGISGKVHGHRYGATTSRFRMK